MFYTAQIAHEGGWANIYIPKGKGHSMPDCQHQSTEPPSPQMTLDKQTSICQVLTVFQL